jgi:PPOX class probable F420-dependent enzyme
VNAPVVALSTIGPDGRPQVSGVWFLAEGDDVSISLNRERQKVKNLRRNPACNLFIFDPATPYRYLEIRGDAEIAEDPDYRFAAKEGAKYQVDLRSFDRPGESRVVVRIKPDKIVGMAQ